MAPSVPPSLHKSVSGSSSRFKAGFTWVAWWCHSILPRPLWLLRAKLLLSFSSLDSFRQEDYDRWYYFLVEKQTSFLTKVFSNLKVFVIFGLFYFSRIFILPWPKSKFPVSCELILRETRSLFSVCPVLSKNLNHKYCVNNFNILHLLRYSDLFFWRRAYGSYITW